MRPRQANASGSPRRGKEKGKGKGRSAFGGRLEERLPRAMPKPTQQEQWSSGGPGAKLSARMRMGSLGASDGDVVELCARSRGGGSLPIPACPANSPCGRRSLLRKAPVPSPPPLPSPSAPSPDPPPSLFPCPGPWATFPYRPSPIVQPTHTQGIQISN